MSGSAGSARSAHDLAWPDLVWSHFSRPRFGAFDERVRAAAAAGYAGIGLYIDEYRRLRDDEGRSAADIATFLDDHGLVLADIEVLRDWSVPGGGPGPESSRLEDLAYELADATGARYVQAIGPYAGSIDQGARDFAALCDRAAAHGLLVGIEWLPFTNIPTPVEAHAIVEAADRPNGGYCADIWHHIRGANDESLVTALEAGRVFAVQMNDGTLRPQMADYKEDCLTFRVPPGEGEFDCVRFVRLLMDMGVRAPISLEVPSTELWAAPAQEAARRSADAMRRVLAAA